MTLLPLTRGRPRHADRPTLEDRWQEIRDAIAANPGMTTAEVQATFKVGAERARWLRHEAGVPPHPSHAGKRAGPIPGGQTTVIANAIQRNPGLSMAEIGRRLGVTRARVQQVQKLLIQRGGK